jgi:hypothetical protein
VGERSLGETDRRVKEPSRRGREDRRRRLLESVDLARRRGGLHGVGMGRLKSRWWSLVGAGERDRREG